MKRKSKLAIAAAAAFTVGLATVGLAHEPGGSQAPWMRGGGPGMQGGGHHEMGGHNGGYGHHEGGRGPGGRSMRMMETFDANNDGKLTQEEVDKVRADRLTQFDADGDGTLSLAEYQALWLDAMRERMVDRFQEHDADGDGKVTVEEFGRRQARMIKRMDRNGDGVFDENDMMPMRRMWDEEGGHHHGPMQGPN